MIALCTSRGESSRYIPKVPAALELGARKGMGMDSRSDGGEREGDSRQTLGPIAPWGPY